MPSGPISSFIQQIRKSVLQHDDDSVTDAQLLKRFASQHEEFAFATMVLRHGPMVLGVCRRVLGHVQDAEDAFQATFLILARKASSIGAPELLGNWLYGTAYRIALKAKARRRVREKQVQDMPHPLVEPDLDSDELLSVLDRELSRLADKYRVPVVLCDLEGKSRREVARQLRVPEGTLSSRLATARKMLAKRLAARGLAPSSAAIATALSRDAASACVPRALVSSTVSAAASIAAGKAAVGLVSTTVASLTEGALKAMFLTKLKFGAGVVLAALFLMGGAGALTYRTVAAPPAEPNNHTVRIAFPLADKVRPISQPVEIVVKDDVRRVAEPPKFKPIDAVTIAAYEKLGFHYCEFEVQPFGFIKSFPGEEETGKRLPGIQFLHLDDTLLPKLPPIEVPFGLSLGNTKVTDAGLKELKGLKNLTTLELMWTPVTDVGLKELKDLKNLESLSLSITQVTDAGMKELKDLKNLKSLFLGDRISDAGLKELKNIETLTALYVGGKKITDAGLKELKNYKNLATLNLNGANVTDEGLKELRELKNLTMLELGYAQVTDAGLKSIKDLKNLTSLCLFGTQVTDAGVNSLKELKNLAALDLSYTKVTDAGLKELKEALPKCKIVQYK